MPLLKERIAIMRQVGTILCDNFGGSYAGFLSNFQRSRRGLGTALELVQTVVDTFPCFRDERSLGGHRVCFWKRAQILVAETWAAFFPVDPSAPHPLFPSRLGPCISELTMFADYRVPQILHHLGILVYPPLLQEKLRDGENVPPGSDEEISLRAASIIGVEHLRDEIGRLRGDDGRRECQEINSVLIDFYLWDLAKEIESGNDRVEGIECVEILPAHRTRSIWY
ncbi:hypothetical protein JVU11DRAFT_3495 [Chiua virens]|nr:hypothetical protein JVU11DRAFT_3495 [Chiua virens]